LATEQTACAGEVVEKALAHTIRNDVDYDLHQAEWKNPKRGRPCG
jgi:hypothetical protein